MFLKIDLINGNTVSLNVHKISMTRPHEYYVTVDIGAKSPLPTADKDSKGIREKRQGSVITSEGMNFHTPYTVAEVHDRKMKLLQL